MAATVVAGAVVTIANLRDGALANSERELKNTALILADQIDRDFRAVELIESGLIERVNALGIATAGEYERRLSGNGFHLVLKDKVNGWPHIGSITLINAQGKLFNFSRFWPPPDINVVDRDFYKALKSDARLTSFMGQPVRNRATGTWTIHLVRKVVGPDGQFLGLVLGAMEMNYFGQIFKTVALGDGSRISLYRDDGMVLANYPPIDPRRASSDVKNGPLIDVLARTRDGTVQENISIDGEERIVVAQRLAHYPFVIAATKTDIAILAEWRNLATYISSAAILLILVIGIIVFLGVRQIGNYELMVRMRAEADQRLQLDAAINNISTGLLMFDADERVVVCNRHYIEMHGLSSDVVKPGCTFREVILHRKQRGSFSGDPDQYLREIQKELADNKRSAHSVQAPGGRTIRIVNHPLVNGGWVSTHDDITERQNAMAEIERTQAFLNTVIENVPVTIFVKNAHDGRYILVNRAGEALWGIPRDDVIGKTAQEIFPKSAADSIDASDLELVKLKRPQADLTRQIETPNNGSRLVTSKRIAILDEDKEPQYLLGVVEDVTERKRADERIVYMAHHDLLTGLANRSLFMEKIEQAGARLRVHGETFAVFMLDLDRFKDVNDSLGHPAGDVLLREVAQRLKSILCETDVLARLGGDEFAILHAGETRDQNDAIALASKAIEVLSEPYDINGTNVVIGATIGIAQAPADGTEPAELMKKADLALYRKKSQGRNGYYFFDAQLTAAADERLQLGQDLRHAISNNGLEVHYQLITDATTQKPCGAEALVRWRHPQRGNIPPIQFIPLAEETGLIIPLGEWVLQQACADAAKWPSDIKIAVNLSPAQFTKVNLLDIVLCALVESGLPPERLELEITESVLIENQIDVLPTIRQLKRLGVSIALDDFGTGYSSLSYLTMFPFDKIKIDKSFTQNMTNRTECAAIVSSVLTLGHGLGITTTAEGVETDEQFQLLRAAGVNTVQGYLFGRPCPVSQLDFSGKHRGQTATNAA